MTERTAIGNAKSLRILWVGLSNKMYCTKTYSIRDSVRQKVKHLLSSRVPGSTVVQELVQGVSSRILYNPGLQVAGTIPGTRYLYWRLATRLKLRLCGYAYANTLHICDAVSPTRSTSTPVKYACCAFSTRPTLWHSCTEVLVLYWAPSRRCYTGWPGTCTAYSGVLVCIRCFTTASLQSTACVCVVCIVLYYE